MDQQQEQQQQPCKKCGSNLIKIVEMPPDHVHKFKKVCIKCNAFISWYQYPFGEILSNNLLIDELMKCNLSYYNTQFLNSIMKLKKLSPKQQAYFNKLVENNL